METECSTFRPNADLSLRTPTNRHAGHCRHAPQGRPANLHGHAVLRHPVRRDSATKTYCARHGTYRALPPCAPTNQHSQTYCARHESAALEPKRRIGTSYCSNLCQLTYWLKLVSCPPPRRLLDREPAGGGSLRTAPMPLSAEAVIR